MKSLKDMSDEDVVELVHKKVKSFNSAFSDWRDEAREAFDIREGRQWPSEDLSYLKEQNRPPVTFNRVSKFIDGVCGAEVNNKMEWKYSVVGIEDTAAVDLTSRVVKQLTQEESEAETTASFRDMVTCGYGWTDTRIDYMGAIEGKLVDEHIDPGQVGWDPKARKRNFSDARWCWRIKRYTADELDEEWEGASDKVKAGGKYVSAEADSTGSLMDEGEYNFDDIDDGEDKDLSSTGEFSVVCYQQMEARTMIVAVNPVTGKTETLTKQHFDEVKKKLGDSGIEVRTSAKKKQRVWYHAYVCGNVLLADVEELPFRTLEPMTGKYDRNKKYHYGIVRHAKDPQLWENKFRSNIMHILSSAGKGIMIEEDAIPMNAWRDFEKDWSRPDKIKKLSPGAISQGKIKAPDAVPLPSGLADLMASAAAAVPDVLGLSPEFLGLAGRTQSGVVEESRRQAGLAVIAEFFQSRREHIKRTGRIKMGLVLKFMPDSVFMRIGGQESQAVLPQLRDADFEAYDVSVDEAPVSPDQKAAVWADIMQIAPVLIPMGLPPAFWLTVLQYSPFPASLVEKLGEALTQPNPQADQAAQIEMAQKMADVDETKSKTMLNVSKAQSEGEPDMSNVISAQAQAAKSQQDAVFKQQEHGMKMQRLQAETQAKGAIAAHDVAASRTKLAATAQTAIIKGLVDIEKMKQQRKAGNAKGS